MGTYYLYCNLDLREYFGVGVARDADKLGGVGRGLGARALGLLLLPGARWSGHRILVAGDEAELPKELRALIPATRLTTEELLEEAFRRVDWLPLRTLIEADWAATRSLLAGPKLDLWLLRDLYGYARAERLAGYPKRLKEVYGKDWRERARASEQNGFAEALEALHGAKWVKRVRKLLIAGDLDPEDEGCLASLPYDDFEFSGRTD